MHWPLPFDGRDALKNDVISTLAHLDLGCLLLSLVPLSYQLSILRAQTRHVKTASRFCMVLGSNWNS